MHIQQNLDNSITINLHKEESALLLSYIEWTLRKISEKDMTSEEITLAENILSDLNEYLTEEDFECTEDNITPIRLIKDSYND